MKASHSLVSIILAASVAACGGGSDDDTTPPPTGGNEGGSTPPPSQSTQHYSINVDFNTDGGNVYPSSAEVEAGEGYTFTIEPRNGFEVGSATGCDGELDNYKYDVVNVQEDCTIIVSFSRPSNQYRVDEILGTKQAGSYYAKVPHSKQLTMAGVTSNGDTVRIVRTTLDNIDASLRTLDRIQWNDEVIYSAPDTYWEINRLAVKEDGTVAFWLFNPRRDLPNGSRQETELRLLQIKDGEVSQINIDSILKADAHPDDLWFEDDGSLYLSFVILPGEWWRADDFEPELYLHRYDVGTQELTSYEGVWNIDTKGEMYGNALYRYDYSQEVLQEGATLTATVFDYNDEGQPYIESVTDITGGLPFYENAYTRLTPPVMTPAGLTIRDQHTKQTWMLTSEWDLMSDGHISVHKGQAYIASTSNHAAQGCTISKIDENGVIEDEPTAIYHEIVNPIVGYQNCNVSVVRVTADYILLADRRESHQALTRLVPQ